MKNQWIKSLLSGLAMVLVIGSVVAFKNMSASRNAVNAVRAVQRIEFDFASSSVRQRYHPDLDKLAQSIKTEKYVLALRGHADSIGNYVSNWKLSEKRANEVKKYLIEKGVSETSVVTTPFGSTIPIASNKTPSGRQKNRRVEVNITE